MAGWEGAAQAGGEMFNKFLIKGLSQNEKFRKFWEGDAPQPELPPAWRMAKQHEGPLSAYLGEALSGEMGYDPQELMTFQTEANLRSRRGIKEAETGLLGNYGQAHGISQQQLAQIHSQGAESLQGAMTNIYLMQENLKRQNQQGAVNALLGAQNTGYNQYISGAFPYEAGAWMHGQQEMGGLSDTMTEGMLMSLLTERGETEQTGYDRRHTEAGHPRGDTMGY